MIKALLKQIARDFNENNISMYYVGGCVRDEILDIPTDDIDICLVGVENKKLVEDIVRKYGNITAEIGKNFPNWVSIIDSHKVDFALARKEKLVGGTRKEFECSTDKVTIEDDLYRRDITINAIAKNVLTDEIIDPYEGIIDLEDKVARPVSEAFAEDTLRVIRAGRFIAKFNLTPSKSLITLCKQLNPKDISNERVGMELMKLFKLESGTKVSKFFYFLKEVGWLQYHFQELYDLIGVPQSPKHHPEGDAFVHTMHCVDTANDWFMRTVMLCHDLGKANCTTIDGIDCKIWEGDKQGYSVYDFKIQSIGHESAGVELTRRMLKRIHLTSHEIINKIGCLVELHMIRAVYTKDNEQKIVRRNLRKLMHYELDYELLVETVRCDLAGRPPLLPINPDIGQELAKKLIEDDDMKPVVTGRLLKETGIRDGEEMGKMIKVGLDLQDRGVLNRDNWRNRLIGSGFKSLKYEK